MQEPVIPRLPPPGHDPKVLSRPRPRPAVGAAPLAATCKRWYGRPIGRSPGERYRRVRAGEAEPLHEETNIRSILLGALLAAAVVLLPGPGLVSAASCNGASHQPSLSGGTVAPGSAITGSTFRFSVTYRDTGNCAPNYVRVRINGVGTFSMSGGNKDWDGGVRFSRAVRLTSVGGHAYVFLASSGSGNGQKSVQLTDVQPRRVVVEAPQATPKPTPKPTAVPTPRPTVAPTRGPEPTAKPTRRPTASPNASQTKRPRASRQPSASPSEAAEVAGPGPTQRPGGFRWLPRPRYVPPSGFDLFNLGVDPAVVRVGQWGAVTAGGLGLLLLLSARRGDDRREHLVVARTGFPAPDGTKETSPTVATPLPEDAPGAPPSRRDEANMPRWLRPSVQAGREGRSLDD